MKLKTKLLVLLFLMFFAFQTGVFAKTVNGKVVTVDLIENSLEVLWPDDSTGVEEKTSIKVNPHTAFLGIHSLTDLKSGDSISIEVQFDVVSEHWIASSVTR